MTMILSFGFGSRRSVEKYQVKVLPRLKARTEQRPTHRTLKNLHLGLPGAFTRSCPGVVRGAQTWSAAIE